MVGFFAVCRKQTKKQTNKLLVSEHTFWGKRRQRFTPLFKVTIKTTDEITFTANAKLLMFAKKRNICRLQRAGHLLLAKNKTKKHTFCSS